MSYISTAQGDGVVRGTAEDDWIMPGRGYQEVAGGWGAERSELGAR